MKMSEAEVEARFEEAKKRKPLSAGEARVEAAKLAKERRLGQLYNETGLVELREFTPLI